MSLLLFLAVTGLGGVAALVARRREGVAQLVGIVAMAVALVAALAIQPGDTVDVAGQTFGLTLYSRNLVMLATAALLLAILIGVATAPVPALAPAALLVLGASAATLAATEAPTALLLVVAAGTLALLAAWDAERTRALPPVLARDLRATVVAGGLGIVAAAGIIQAGVQAVVPDALFGMAYVAMAGAVAIRFGTIPLHLWVGRMADVVPTVAVPLSTVIAPAVLALVALTWVDGAVFPFLIPLEVERATMVLLALLTLLLGAVAAWIQDDLEHLVGYSIAQDAGFVVLALAVVDASAWSPGRIWIAVLVLVKIALASWAHALSSSYGTRRIEDLRGWARRSPLLALSLVVIAIATVGVPGILVWDVRATLVGLAVEWPLSIVAGVGAFAAVLYYGRLLVTGLGRPTERVASGAGERPVGSAPDSTDLAGRARQAWSLTQVNRGLIAGLLTLVVALMSLVVAAGGFGIDQAAGGDGTVSGGYTDTGGSEPGTGPTGARSPSP